MGGRARPKLTYANVVATLALFFALGGSVVAGTHALTGKVTKAKVRKIAAQEITKAAPALSVGHATSADSAASAGSAANATNAAHATSADNAANAETLGGFPASALLRTAGAGTANAPDANGTALTTSIQAPAPGFVTIFATADFVYGAATDQVECGIEIDEASDPATVRITNVSGAANVDSDCATNVTKQVTAGAHKIDLEIRQLNDAGVQGAGLSVIYTPFNASGGSG
jgi:hypothetical protein